MKLLIHFRILIQFNISIMRNISHKVTLFFLILTTIQAYSQLTIKLKKDGGTFKLPCKVNGIPLDFYFDTGASDVSISLNEAKRMIQLGLIDKSDFLGTAYYSDANGRITEGIKVNLKVLEIDKIVLKNVEASIQTGALKTSLLLGQTALKKIGKIEFNPQNETITILNKSLINNSITYDLFRDIILNESGLIDNFCGFKLLQYEDSVYNELGEPSFGKFLEDEEESIAYVKPDDILIFHIDKLEESSEFKQITSIQLTGFNSTHSVRGIKLGSNFNEVLEVFGTPSKITDVVNDYGDAKFIEYDDTNISFELNNDIVRSICVFWGNNTPENRVGNEQLSNVKFFKSAIATFNSKELMALFAPDFQITATQDDNIYFDKGFQKDQLQNLKLINFINSKTKGLKSLLNPKIKFKTLTRIKSLGGGNIMLLPVIKVSNSNYIKEIVLKQYFGKLLIWEIN
jgi:clan AA aspartic protease (TIGR02281 family)